MNGTPSRRALVTGGSGDIGAAIADALAAQAMAAHFSLVSGVRGESTTGLLGALRDVECATSRLDDVASPLIVRAERLSHDAAGSIYAFRVHAQGDERPLLSGRATVVQQRRATTATP